MPNNSKLHKNLQNSSLLDFYYGDIYCGPYIDEDVSRTDKTISYLKDCGFSDLEITKELSRHKEARITGDNLNDILWKNSLIKKGAFYLHRELRIVSQAPIFDLPTNTLKTFPFYCEMKIRYTVGDVLDYFYSKLSQLSLNLIDRKSDTKIVTFLMSKYSQVDYVEPLDIILCSIDFYTKEHPDCYKLIDVVNDNYEVIRTLQAHMVELDSINKRQNTWR